MFERFTKHAIKVIMLAQEEARMMGHNFVGTEQVLLGLMGERVGLATVTLSSMGVTLKDMRAEVEKIIGRGTGFVAVEIPFTPHAKHLLERSWEQARELAVNAIDTEHLLLGLLDQHDGKALQVLQALKIEPSELRSMLLAPAKQGAPVRKFMVMLRPALSRVSALAVSVASIGQTLSNLHDDLGINKPKPEILQDAVIHNALVELTEELEKLDQGLNQYSSRLHEQISTLKADILGLTTPDQQ